MKLVKIISTNEYKFIKDEEYNSDIHIDRTLFPIYLDKYSYLDGVDYISIRNLMSDALINRGGFSELNSDEEKDIVLKYTKLVIPEEAISYFMNKGFTYNEAQSKYLLLRTTDIRNAANCFKDRIESPEFMVIIYSYLGATNSEIFIDNARNFLFDLMNTAIIGTEYGNTRNGFMDYVNDTGDYVGTGASTFFNLPDEQTKYDEFKELLTSKILG